MEEKEEGALIAKHIAPTVSGNLSELQNRFAENQFSIILLSCPVYREQIQAVIKGISHLIKPDGVLVMSFQNVNYYTRVEQRFQSERQTEEDRQSYSLEEIVILLEKERLKVTAIRDLPGDVRR